MQREGFSVTQASVSRDIRELGLVKLAGRYLPAARAMAASANGEPLQLEVGLISGLEPIGANLVVVKTHIGAANSVAALLDQEFGKSIAGTIAGDDTVFVAVRSRSDQGRVVARLNGWLKQSHAADESGDELAARHTVEGDSPIFAETKIGTVPRRPLKNKESIE
jgi:transcriptional regulator of arginine metabolism